MKRLLHSSLLLAGLLFCISAYPVSNYADHLQTLQSLIKNKLLFSHEADNDSIILWEKQLEPALEKQKDYKLLFQLKQMVVSAYATRGDICMAVDYARQMYKKALQMNYSVGIALSSRAIGDAYLNSNIPQEAIESYKEAIDLLNQLPDTELLEAQMLPKYILTLLKYGPASTALPYIKQLEDLYINDPNPSTLFFILACNTYYDINTGQLDKARKSFAQLDTVYKENNFIYYRAILTFIKAAYYEADNEYALALQHYTRLIGKSSIKLAPTKLIQIKQEQGRLLSKMGRDEEACRVYQTANALQDSINALSYTRQINELRAIYQTDRMEIHNQIQRNRFTLWIIITVVLLMLLIAGLILLIKKDNKRLRQSKQELEKAQKSAENSIRAKSLLLSNMSHEIRTPLNALSGFSAILTEESIDKETRRQCNDIIQQNSELLLKLINDVIDLSSLEVGKIKLNIREYDAVSICRNVVDTVEKVKQTHAGVKFHTSLESLALQTDASRLQQILINLLINATKFTTCGTITLELQKQPGDVALFSVTDTGCGIPAESQKQIFNRFEKLNEGVQGTGLGLSICQLIIRQIGGEIWIDPDYTGGSRFCFTHPIHTVSKKGGQQ